MHVIRDKQVRLSVAVIIEPRGAGAEICIVNAALRRHVAKMPVAFVVEQPVAVERRDVNIGQAVVVVVSNRNAHAIHLDV